MQDVFWIMPCKRYRFHRSCRIYDQSYGLYDLVIASLVIVPRKAIL